MTTLTPYFSDLLDFLAVKRNYINTKVHYRFPLKLLDWVINFSIFCALKYKQEFNLFCKKEKGFKGVLQTDNVRIDEKYLKYAKDLEFLSNAVYFCWKEVLKQKVDF